MPGFLGFSWQNSGLKVQPFHEGQVILISVNIIPAFLGYSWQCSSQLIQPLCESQEIFGTSWFSWLFLLFLLWSNSRLSLKTKSYLLALQTFLGITLKAFQESQDFLCLSGIFQAFQRQKSMESQESQQPLALWAFLGFFCRGAPCDKVCEMNF